MITIIVPVYNEEKALTENSTVFKELSQYSELIFVDGGSVDNSRDIAGRFGKVISSEKGRAHQMNSGASIARFPILLFLHADTFISSKTIESIKSKIEKDGFIGGGLTQRIQKEKAVYRFIEVIGNSRAAFGKVFYGDQGIFVKKDVFLKINGFPEVPIMEDVLFTRALQKFGKVGMLPDKIFVSPRRWEEKGIIKTVLFYSGLNFLFWIGIPLDKIKTFYGDVR